MAAYRPEFTEALRLLALACADLESLGHRPPVLVGGAAVEFYTGGAVTSGDFDFVGADTRAFGKALIAHGFRREDRRGWVLMGWYHPELGIGVQVVSGVLLDGKADPDRIRLVEVVDGKGIAVEAIEDLIADRLGQYVATTPRPFDMRDQAQMLYRLADGLDEQYLDRRIREDTNGELSIADLKP